MGKENMYDDEIYDDEFYDSEIEDGVEFESEEAEEQLNELHDDMFFQFFDKEKEKYNNADIKDPGAYNDRADYGENRWRHGVVGFLHGVVLGFLTRIREVLSVLIFGDKDGLFLGAKRDYDRQKRADEFRKTENESDKQTEEKTNTQEKVKAKETEIKDKDITEEIKNILDDKNVINIYKNQGINIEKSDDETKMILSLESGEKLETDIVYGTGKDDAMRLGEYIYQLEHPELKDNPSATDDEKNNAKIQSALKAAIIIAGINGSDRDILLNMDYKNKDSYTLSKISIMTEDGISKIQINAVKDNKDISDTAELSAQILYNNQEIAKIPIEQVITPEKYSAELNNEIYANAHKCYDDAKTSIMEIGKGDKTVSFNKENDGVHIYLNNKRAEVKDLGVFKIESEKDINDITKALESNGWKNDYNKRITVPGRLNANAVAYTIGVITNPSMVSSISKEKEYYEPLSGQYKEAGNSYLSIVADANRIAVQKNIATQGENGISFKTEDVAGYHSIGELASSQQQINAIACKIQDAFVNEIEKNSLIADVESRIATNTDIGTSFENGFSSESIEKNVEEFVVDKEVDISDFVKEDSKDTEFYVEENEDFVQSFMDNIEVVDNLEMQDADEIDL